MLLGLAFALLVLAAAHAPASHVEALTPCPLLSPRRPSSKRGWSAQQLGRGQAQRGQALARPPGGLTLRARERYHPRAVLSPLSTTVEHEASGQPPTGRRATLASGQERHTKPLYLNGAPSIRQAGASRCGTIRISPSRQRRLGQPHPTNSRRYGFQRTHAAGPLCHLGRLDWRGSSAAKPQQPVRVGALEPPARRSVRKERQGVRGTCWCHCLRKCWMGVRRVPTRGKTCSAVGDCPAWGPRRQPTATSQWCSSTKRLFTATVRDPWPNSDGTAAGAASALLPAV